jgi:hypothetical protein
VGGGNFRARQHLRCGAGVLSLLQNLCLKTDLVVEFVAE